MGYPDPQQNPGQHPGGQNYPAQQGPGGYQPTRPIEQGNPGAVPDGSPGGDPNAYPAGNQGGYELGYGPGAYGPDQGQAYGGYGGQQPPQGPPPPPGGDGSDGSGGGNKKALWIAIAAVLFVLVLAAVVVGVATSGSDNTSASSTPAPTTRTTTTEPTTGGFTLPSGIPSSISLPPIFGGGSTTGPNARQWQVEVTGSGSAQVVTIGVPDTSLFGSQPLPWSKSFASDSPLVTITVIGYTGDVSCKITRNGTVVSEQKSSSDATGGGPLICTSGR